MSSGGRSGGAKVDLEETAAAYANPVGSDVVSLEKPRAVKAQLSHLLFWDVATPPADAGDNIIGGVKSGRFRRV
jgi:hypothetical protein